MERKGKMWIAGILTLCLCAGLLSGCGGQTSAESTTAAENATEQAGDTTAEQTGDTAEEALYSLPIYEVEWLEVEFTLDSVSEAAAGEEVLYLYGAAKRNEDELWNRYMIISCNLDGTNQRTVFACPYTPKLVELSEGETHIEIASVEMEVDSEGNLIVGFREYHHAYEQDKKTVFRIAKYDRDGNELWSTELPENTNFAHFILVEDQIVCAIRPVGDHAPYGPTQVFVYDGKGSLVRQHDTGEVQPLNLRCYGGQVYLFANTDYIDENKVLREFDLETGEFGKGYTSDIVYDGRWFDSGCGYDILTNDGIGIWGYNFGADYSVKVLDFELSGLEPIAESVMIPVGEHDFRLFVNHTQYDGTKPQFARLTRLPSKAMEEKQQITVAEFGGSYHEYLRDMNYQFNRESELYQVNVIDYEKLDDLKRDIENGIVPDVLLLSEGAVRSLYGEFEKGTFEDMYPWIDGDEELSRDMLCEAALRAGELDGKLYSLISSFKVYSLAGKASIFGPNDGWTPAEMLAISQQYPESELYVYKGSQYMIGELVRNSGTALLDEKTGMVNFNSEFFLDMLELAKHVDSIESIRGDRKNWYKQNDILLQEAWIENYSSLHNIAEQFGEDFSCIGYAGYDGNRSILHPVNCILMLAESDCKEGAWAFIRSFLQEEYQETEARNIPILLSAQEKQAEDYLAWREQYDRYGNVTMIRYATEEEVEMINEAIQYSESNLYQDAYLRSDMLELVKEKTALYFSGEKTAQAVAEEIQQWVEARISKPTN